MRRLVSWLRGWWPSRRRRWRGPVIAPGPEAAAMVGACGFGGSTVVSLVINLQIGEPITAIAEVRLDAGQIKQLRRCFATLKPAPAGPVVTDPLPPAGNDYTIPMHAHRPGVCTCDTCQANRAEQWSEDKGE